MALVTVLAVTLLMTVLILSFFTHSLNERKSARSFNAALHADMLAQSGINLVVGILREGMTQTESYGTDELPRPYTTQPGALRVHRLDGSLHALYKLYSSDRQIAQSWEEALRDVPEDWNQHPLEYVDLNEPAITIDPLKPYSLGAATIRFPIVDPRQYSANSQESVEGFSYPAHGRRVAGIAGPEANDYRQRLPMPVRWLYVLEDGTMGVLTHGGTRFKPVRGEGMPSRTNPARGRLAFWTDDESAKININTASEGVYWDTPRASTHEEVAFGRYQPAAGEYNRFPGHPAGVCLSSVLFPNRRFYASEAKIEARADGTVLQPLDEDIAERLWHKAPVLRGWPELTSHGGWKMVPGLDREDPFPAVADLTPRLTSPGELRWAPPSAANDSAPPAHIESRKLDPLFESHPDALTRLERGSFFLTASSHAPETTLFGTPRISIWPLHTNIIPGQGESEPIYNKRGSMHDYMISLSTTLNGRRYYWARGEPADGFSNFHRGAVGSNKLLFNYTRALTNRPVPGFWREGLPSTFAQKYGAGERDDRDNILLTIFDYIRQVNLNDGELKPEQQFPVVCPEDPKLGFGQISPLYAADKPKARKVKDLKRNDLFAARGIGRIATVSEVALVIVCRAEYTLEGQLRGEPSSHWAETVLRSKPGSKELEMAVIVEGFVPSQGWGEYRPYMAVSFGGKPESALEAVGPLPLMTLQRRPLELLEQDRARNGTKLGYSTFTTSQEISNHWLSYGGAIGPRFSITEITDTSDSELKQQGVRSFNSAFLFKPIINMLGKDSGLEFSGGMKGTQPALQLAIYDLPSRASTQPEDLEISDLMQTIPLALPPIQNLQLPDLPSDNVEYSLAKRLEKARMGGRLLSKDDVVQSLVPAHGDYRLIAASRTLDLPPGAPETGTQVFVPHPLYGRARQAHSLTEQLPWAREAVLGIPPDQPHPGTNEGSSYGLGYIPDLPVPAAVAPDFPWQPYVKGNQVPRVFPDGTLRYFTNEDLFNAGRLDGGARGPAAPHLTGDFDNGLAFTPDGPYINRTDDGETTGYANQGVPYFDVSPPQPHKLPPPRPRIWGAHRQLPSPVMFGSLPTGVKARVPWQTLLFRPQKNLDPTAWSKATDHYGWSWPRDHLLLDLFWMPTQEPAALSHALATEGKINLNHRLVPFDYIERTTALHAAMKAEKMLAIPDEASRDYKLPPGQRPAHQSFRHYIDPVETIRQWDEEVFNRGDVFLTTSQLCEHYLVPEGMKGDRESMEQFWKRHRLTGDNSRERPYANLYSRFTTRSNVFRVHVVAESLRLPPPGPDGELDFRGMEVLGRQEGSALIERRLDPQDKDIPDYVAALAQHDMLPPSLEHFYTWRVKNFERFNR